MSEVMSTDTAAILEDSAENLLTHNCETIPQENLYLPGPNFVDDVWAASDRTPRVLRSLQTLFGSGRLSGTGYISILPVDQGIEHSAGASFAKNPIYFDPRISSVWRLKGAAMESPLPMVYWDPSHVSMRTRSPLS